MSFSKLLMGCAFASFAMAANAADLPARTSPARMAAPLATSWTGFYVGATAGYNFFTNTANGYKPNGASIGIRAGYDHQIAPAFVIGALIDGEIDFGKKSFSGTSGVTPYTAELKHRYLVSVDVKAGYLLNDQTMVYAVAGYTNSEIKATATVAAVSDSNTVTGNGWNAGAGVEYRFTKEWSGFAEYRFNQVKKSGSTVELSQAKLGVAYRF